MEISTVALRSMFLMHRITHYHVPNGNSARRPEHSREFGSQYLDRHLAFVIEVVGEVDGRYAAFAETALDLVAVGECGREPDGDLGHI